VFLKKKLFGKIISGKKEIIVMVTFSIIMPTYNRGHIIKSAIESVINQTCQNWELIIVDDGSTDKTSEVISGIADSRIRYIQCEENVGSNHARNIGAEKSSGKYLAFLDSDNQWQKNYLESQLGVLQNGAASVDVVFARCIIAGSWGYVVFPHNLYAELLSNEKIIKCALYNSVFDMNVVCMKRVIWEQSEKFDEKIFQLQDWEYFLRVLVQGKYQFKFNNAVLCDNYLQQDSISNKKELFWDSRLHIFSKHIEKCREMDEVINVVLYLLKQPDVPYILPHHVEKLMRMLSLDEATELCKKYYAEYEDLNCRAEYLLKLSEKNENILQIERKWITLKQNGNDIASMLIEKDIYEIAIYGYGVLGRLLLQELKDSSVLVKYIIDRQKIKLEEGIDLPVITNGSGSSKQMKKVDAVVVTAIMAYEEIRKELGKETNVKIISLEELIC